MQVVAAATVVLELLGDETALWDMRAALLASTEAPPAALIPLLQSGMVAMRHCHHAVPWAEY